jgi:hypothetical protein
MRNHRIIYGGRLFHFSVILTGLFLVTSCTSLSDKQYVQQNPQYRGVQRIAVFLQRWPVYLQQSGQSDLDAEFIKGTTHFFGPRAPAGNSNPRALDVRDIDDGLIGDVLLDALKKKGYQPFLAQALFDPAGTPPPVQTLMAEYQAIDPGVDAFLFCFYAPTLFLSNPLAGNLPSSSKSYSLQEIVDLVGPESGGVTWAGPRAALAAKNSISHAFIYVSLTMFKASNWRPLVQVAGSQAGGRPRPWVPLCPPAPTDQNFWADAGIIRNLMVNNLECRLRHLIPIALLRGS